MNRDIDFFFSQAKNWKQEFETLRMIALDCGLAEALKWGCPCYSLPPVDHSSAQTARGAVQKSNVVLIHGFKEYCALLFFKGALLKDREGILIQQTKNVQAARQIRFTNVAEIVAMKKVLRAYIKEAIEVEKAGLKVNFKTTSEFTIPEEFKTKLSEVPGLKTAFDALTPGRQRAYLFYFSEPKQSKTRESRVAKCTPRILGGKGLDD